MKALPTTKPFTGPIGRQQHSGYPWLNKRPQGWLDAPPRFCGLCHIEFLTHTDVSGPRGHETGEDPRLSLGVAGLCWGVRVPHRSSLWFSMGTIKVHDSPDGPQQWWNSQSHPPKTHRRGTQKLLYTRGGSHSPGQSLTAHRSRTTRGPCDTSFFLFIVKVLWLAKFSYVIRF